LENLHAGLNGVENGMEVGEKGGCQQTFWCCFPVHHCFGLGLAANQHITQLQTPVNTPFHCIVYNNSRRFKYTITCICRQEQLLRETCHIQTML
jgi:hypothetical protein